MLDCASLSIRNDFVLVAVYCLSIVHLHVSKRILMKNQINVTSRPVALAAFNNTLSLMEERRQNVLKFPP